MLLIPQRYEFSSKSQPFQADKFGYVGAWSRGEDVAKSFHDKVRDLMKNLTTNILSQKILENTLKGVERLINDKMKAKSGKLDENDIWDLAERIEKESLSAIEYV